MASKTAMSPDKESRLLALSKVQYMAQESIMNPERQERVDEAVKVAMKYAQDDEEK